MLYQMVMLLMTLGDPYPRKPPRYLHFSSTFICSLVGERGDFRPKFGHSYPGIGTTNRNCWLLLL